MTRAVRLMLIGGTIGVLIAAGLAVPAGASQLKLRDLTPAALVTSPAPAPVVLSISPTQGSGLGGAKVSIVGENLRGVTTVDFGSTVVTLKKVNNSKTKVKAVAPPGTGTVDITVSTPEATSEAVPADRFTYLPKKPAVTKISPSSHGAHLQPTVTITGVNFNGATEVDFGTTSVPFTLVKPTQIKAQAPLEQVEETVDITVVTPQGATEATPADRYTFLAEFPSVEAAGPEKGFAGETVTLTGSGFIGASSVQFGKVDAESFEVVSDKEIRALAPPHMAEKVPVQITTPFGLSPEQCTGGGCKPVAHFTYVPLITSVSPGSGPLAGGTVMTLTGSGFAPGGTIVFVDGRVASGVSCSSTEVCTAEVPEGKHGPGAVPVEVHVPTNYNSKESVSPPSEAARFTYE